MVVGTPPSWTARNGEFVFFNSADTLRIYFYNNTSWGFIEYPAGGGVLITAVSNNVTTASSTLLNVSNNLVAVSNNLVTGSTTILNVSNNLVTVSNNLDTQTVRLTNVSNNLVGVSDGLTTQVTRITNVSNNLVTVSNNLDTQTVRLTNVSNNLATVSNNLDTQTVRLTNVSNNLVTVSDNLGTQIVRLTNVSNNLVTVSNNLDIQATRLTNVSNNLVTTSGNVANLIVQASNGALKGWINFNGIAAQLSILDHYNVQSVTRENAGTYTISWATTFATTAYPVVGMVLGTGGGIRGYVTAQSGGRRMGSTGILCWDNNGATLIDYQDISLMITGDQ